MSETKWNPEPWRVGTYYVRSADEDNILPRSRCNEEDVRRIVACVNACAGLSTDALESGALGELLRHVANIAASDSEWAGDEWRDVTITTEAWDGIASSLRSLGMLK